MLRTVKIITPLLILWSAIVFASNPVRTPENKADQGTNEFGGVKPTTVKFKTKIEIPNTNVSPAASSAVFNRTSYTYSFSGCSDFTGGGTTAGNDITLDITDSGTISTGTITFTLTTTSFGYETRINISNGTDSTAIDPGASSNETNTSYSLDISSDISGWLLAGSWTISVGDSYGDGGGQQACNFTLTVDASTPDLFFSEYIEGSSNNKALEIYNPTGSSVDLLNYQIAQAVNGGGWQYYHTFPTGATLAAGDVWVILNSGVSSSYFTSANADEVLDYPSVVHHNGDDARAIIKISGTDTTFLDIIGDPDNDPGSGWDVAGVSTATKDHTLLRDAGTLWGNTDWTSSAGDSTASEWEVFDQNYFDNLGGYPDNPCFDSLVTVTVVSASFGSEKNFMVQNADGDTLLSCFGCMSSNSTFSDNVCLTDGLYYFSAKDGYGDGWDGATFAVTNVAGDTLVSGSGPTSSEGTNWVDYPFAVGVLLPIVSGLEDIDFAGNILGESATASMRLINTGMADFIISNITVSGSPFATSTTSLTVVPGDTGYIDFTYSPTSETDDEGSVNIAHNASSDGSTITETFGLFGYGVDAILFEDFDPFTGSNTELPMSGWTITDGNGDASTIPEYRKTWYHDAFGLDGSGNMVANIGSGNDYYASEQLTTPSFTVTEPSKASAWVYNYYNTHPLNVIQVSSDGTKDTLGMIFPTQDYINYEFVLNGTGDMQIEFDFSPDSGGSWTYMDLDEVSITVLPNTYINGVVIDNETDAVIIGADVSVGFITGVTDSSGNYSLFGFEPGENELIVEADGYLPSGFSFLAADGDSLVQNVSLVPESSASEIVYETGFESADQDSGVFDLDAGLAFTTGFSYWDSSMVGEDSIDVDAPEGATFVATQGYSNDLTTLWMNSVPIDLTGYDYATVGMKLNVMTEEGWDFAFVFAYSPSFDPDFYYFMWDLENNDLTQYTGNSGGWFDIVGDLTFLIGHDDVQIGVYLATDESITEGFGVAFDSVSVVGYDEPRPWATNLMAGSFVNDQIALSWNAPTGGTRSLSLGRININRPIIPNPDYERGNKGATKINIEEFEVEISSALRTSRDLVSYNVWRAPGWFWNTGEDFKLIDNTTSTAYTDVSVNNHEMYVYSITTVYDEGESIGSDWAYAGAGSVEDHTMAETAIDFEDSTFGLWEVITTQENGWGIGDSASTVSTYSEIPDNGGLFAYVNDDDVGSGVNSQSRLMSPFFNFGDAESATLIFDYYNENSGNEVELWGMVGWDTWIPFGPLPPYETGWNQVSVDVSALTGFDHVRMYFWYNDGDGWEYSAAVDNISIETLQGPTNLVVTSTIDDVILSWDPVGRSSRRNEYPNGVSRAEKKLAQQRRLFSKDIIVSPDILNKTVNRTFSRAQGDSIGNPFVIDSLPYSISASTEGFTHNYDVACNAPYDEVGAPDVVYELTLTEPILGLVVDLCESYYDTKVYIYANGDTNDVVGCSDDYCSASHGQLYTSYLETGPLEAGTYHIVVDGYDVDSYGTYVMDVFEKEPLPDIMYNVYRDGMLLASEIEETGFLDETASQEEACYAVTASLKVLGTDGDSESFVETASSNEACGSVINQPPGDFTLLSPADGDTVVIKADNIGSNQLFAWSASVDPNGTPVGYEICWTLNSPFWQECEDNENSTANFVELEDVTSLIDSLFQISGEAIYTFNWTVYASDGMDETEASNGPRTITFDAGFVLGIEEGLGIPEVFALHQNYPNPFNPVTNIRFDVPEESYVRMDIYNLLGQQVRTMVNETLQPGYHSVRWNGTNDQGKPLSTGMYIYKIQADNFIAVKKLVLMK